MTSKRRVRPPARSLLKGCTSRIRLTPSGSCNVRDVLVALGLSAFVLPVSVREVTVAAALVEPFADAPFTGAADATPSAPFPPAAAPFAAAADPFRPATAAPFASAPAPLTVIAEPPFRRSATPPIVAPPPL